MNSDSMRTKETPMPQPHPGEGQFGVSPGPAQTEPLHSWGDNPGTPPGGAAATNPMPSSGGDKAPEHSAPIGSAGYPWPTPSDAQPNPMPGQGQHGVSPGASQGDLNNDLPETDPKAAGNSAGGKGPEHPFDNPGMGG